MTVVDVEATEVRHEIIPVGSSQLVALAAPLDQIVQAQRTYHEVCVALLDEHDIQVIGKKEFKKRSAWNKLAVAFGVSTTEVRTVHERDERGRIVRTECVVRAQAPNGRVSEGIGACDLYERCCDAGTCRTPLTWPDGNFRHVHCEGFPCRQVHFSNPQHDIPATAFTRASNRAKADLFGMGEVSAEEVEGSGGTIHDNHDSGGGQSGGKPISEKQLSLLSDKAKGRGYGIKGDADLILSVTGSEVTGYAELSSQQASKLIDHLIAMERAQKFAPQDAAAVGGDGDPGPREPV